MRRVFKIEKFNKYSVGIIFQVMEVAESISNVSVVLSSARATNCVKYNADIET